MLLFWEQGYEATAMADIVDATGLSKSSLYIYVSRIQTLESKIHDLEKKMEGLTDYITSNPAVRK